MKRRIICFAMAAVLAFMVPQAPELAAAKKAKKIKLNKTKLSLDVGDTFKLKLKNNKKKVTWSSSKKAVAKVTKKGKVTAVKAGNARITAKVSKKKYICKVHVNKVADNKPSQTVKPVYPTEIMKNVEVINPQNITVTLYSQVSLTKERFTVKLKSNYAGNYIKEVKIKSVTTTDNITYHIVLDNSEMICENNYVQVSINNPDGTGITTRETVYRFAGGKFQAYEIYKMSLNQNVCFTYCLGEYEGYTKINSITGYPAGLTYKVLQDGKNVVFEGSATVAGTFNGAIVSEDEYGNIYTDNITFLVGSENVIAAAYRPVYATGGRQWSEAWGELYVVGGQGEYSYEIVEENIECQLSYEYSYNHGKGDLYFATYNSEPGSYQVKVKITDSYNAGISTYATCDVNIIAKRFITGTVKDGLGNTINSNVTVYFKNRDKTNPFVTEVVAESETGEYFVWLPDGTYDMYATVSNSRSEVMTCQINSEKSGLDFVVPVYPVTLIGAVGDGWIPERVSGVMGDYSSYNINDNILYLKEGPYKFTYESWDGSTGEEYRYVIAGTVMPGADNTCQISMTKN